MSGTLALSTANPLSSVSNNRLFSSNSTGLNRRMSFAYRTPFKSTVQATAGVIDRRQQVTTNLYEVLRVKKNASPIEIKTAYRNLAKMYHPDASESDGQDFIEIHNAYATLSDPAARAVYDMSLGGVRDLRSFSYAAGGSQSRFYTSRRWETDQCW